MVSRHFQIVSNGTFLIIYTFLYALRNDTSLTIEDIAEDIKEV
jgi:hypothetical protein